MPKSIPVIVKNSCAVVGHNIASLRTELYDPTSKSIIVSAEPICTKCGLSLEEVRELKIPLTRPGARKSKEQEAIPQ